MQRDVATGPEVYRPGAFWDELVAVNIDMIRTQGIDNLKRTVSTNYFNWLPLGLKDVQVQAAVRHWLRDPTVANLRIRTEPLAELRTCDRETTFSVNSTWRTWLYGFFVGAAWEQARREDAFALTERLAEPDVGNPIRTWRGSKLISQDLANSIIECSFAGSTGAVREGSRVAELGAGYGRLAHVFASAFELTYCIFDIPPALAISQWYLGQVLGDTRITPYRAYDNFDQVEEGLRPGTVAFFTPNQLELFPDGWFDLTQTISTLPEMPERQATRFLELLAAKSGSALFLKQWRSWRNPADGVEMSESDYRVPAGWKLVRRRVDPVQPAFFNQLWASETGMPSGPLQASLEHA